MNFLQLEEILIITPEQSSKIENKRESKKEETYWKDNCVNHSSWHSCSHHIFLLSTKTIRVTTMALDCIRSIFNQ